MFQEREVQVEADLRLRSQREAAVQCDLQIIQQQKWIMNGQVHAAEEERYNDGAEHADHHDRGEVVGEVPDGFPASCGY